MTMIDTNAYEVKYFVHEEDTTPWYGTEFSDEIDAINSAREQAEEYSDTYVVTELLERVVGQTTVAVSFERS